MGYLSVFKNIINGLEEFKVNSFFLPLIALVDSAVKLIGLKLFGFNGLVYGLVLSNCLQLLIGIHISRKLLQKWNINILFGRHTEFYQLILSFTFPNLIYITITILGSVISSSIYMSTDNGALIMGGFTTFVQLQAIITFIPFMLLNPMLATLTSSFKENYFKTIKTCYKISIIFFFVLLFLSICMYLFSKELLMIYGEEFVKYKQLFRLFIPTMLFQVVNPFINQIMIATDHMWQMSISRFLWLISLCILSYMLKSRGLYGLVVSSDTACFLWFAALTLCFATNAHKEYAKKRMCPNVL